MSEDEVLRRVTLPELRTLVWTELRYRPHPAATREELLQLLRMESPGLPDNPINGMREEIMHFIAAHRGRLTLPCSGNCYEHPDLRVVFCHQLLLEEQSATTEEEE